MLYPLKFKPIYKERIWGGTRLKTLFKKDFSPLPNCGESWELSGVDDNISVVENGFLAGNSLNELVEIYMGDLVGERVYEMYGNEFPLLVKLLDTDSQLSIQVHPADDYAMKNHNSLGKTEMWVVLEAEDNAEIITGFNRDVTKEEYIHHLESRTLRNILNIERAAKGDVYFIPPGRIHAIGAGITLLEIQQTSDLTYRVYDYDRLDENGNQRQLHTKQALDVIDFAGYSSYKTHYNPVKDNPVEMVSCQYFTTRLLELTIPIEMDYMSIDSFVIACCIEGSAKLNFNEGEEHLKTGDVILIPAELKNISITPHGKCKIVESFIT